MLVNTVNCCGWILACVVLCVQGRYGDGVEAVASAFSSEFPGIPCDGLRMDTVLQHTDVVPCDAKWEGSIGKANGICVNGWHLCSWNDTEVLRVISWYEATHVSGCYVANAAHDGSTCGPCHEKNLEGEMAAIGADCVKSDPDSNSCFGSGRIDGSFSAIPQYTPCYHAPWITGVLCCRNKVEGQKPEITRHPDSRINVLSGSPVELKCESSGDPAPTYGWYKNGQLLQTTAAGDGSLLRIDSATLDDAGLYQCKAKNRYGVATSYKCQLRVNDRELKDIAVGCKDPTRGRALASADVSVCDGKWWGHVKRASKSLCAVGWRVCSLADLNTVYSASWEEVTSLPGCYAYNAATSRFYPCTKCTMRHKGNVMSGMGSGCGDVAEDGYSCLRRGRIDVHAFSQLRTQRNNTAATRAKKKLHSCQYAKGVTTGVACCKKPKRQRTGERQKSDKIHKRRNGRPCSRRRRCGCERGIARALCQQRMRALCEKPCKENSYCNRRGKCVCSRGFRRLNGSCVAKDAVSRESAPSVASCETVTCLHGGVCENGKCKCKGLGTGPRCEILFR